GSLPFWWLDEQNRLGGRPLRVQDGSRVEAGQPLTAGDIDPAERLAVLGVEDTGSWLLEQVRQVYRHHSRASAARHFEVVLARMLGCVRVIDPGGTTLRPGQVLPRSAFQAANARLPAGAAATCRPHLLGVSQVPAHAGGWLGAASFQRTVKV